MLLTSELFNRINLQYVPPPHYHDILTARCSIPLAQWGKMACAGSSADQELGGGLLGVRRFISPYSRKAPAVPMGFIGSAPVIQLVQIRKPAQGMQFGYGGGNLHSFVL